ncbi:hypothetical protein SAMN03080598_03087 [Algoriphagus boritolerans DSM 17298 = JCM 18970]|uniref:Dolichyl-phosphate-mannose-protein mannosyltransferase n=1 Tax=Algoriphagus boritolerans DSM 17298 = JCM 18970 TaxID=1120964 RepID=A0A1H5YN58_9BACT|nr:hypothetical protein SAMN03080598_03087 [Algoriphagus boritolerans DSM 17298 = JCM 18970]
MKYLWYKFSEILGQALISDQTKQSHSETLLSFFKVNDPFRLIGVAAYLILLAVLAKVFFDFPMTEPRLLWMVLGERLSDGFFLFQDTIDDTGPLAAGFFAFVDLLFGRSDFAYELIGRLLVLFQIIHWNVVLIRYRVFDENTYLPAIIMAALFHLSFEMVGLSPTLLGSTFLVLAIGQLFSQTVLQKETSESTLLIGIYGGIATGFHLNFVIFLPYLIFTGIAISGFSFRQLLLALIGFFLPLLLVLVFFFWNNGHSETLQILPEIFTYKKYSYQPLASWMILAGFPLILALVGYFYSAVLRGSTINQQKQRQLIILWLVFSLIQFLLVKRQAAFQLLIFIPGLTYLITQFFLNMRRGMIAKLAFLILLFGLPVGGWWFIQTQLHANSTYFVKTQTGNLNTSGEKIMVLSEDSSPYLENSLGGPFLNFNLTKAYLASEKTLEQKAQIFQNLINQKPQLVIDPEGIFKNLLEELPALKNLYNESEPGIFRLK